MKILRERMLRCQWGRQVTVRMWVADEGQDDDYFDDLRRQVVSMLQQGPGRPGLADEIIALDGMNAVEVLGTDGIGVVLYKDWP